jgi:hypothetical protein
VKEAFVSDVHSERGDRRRDSADILQGIKARPPTGVGEDFYPTPLLISGERSI